MSMFCGVCGACLNPSDTNDWWTDKEKPETGCGSCGHGMHKLRNLWRAYNNIVGR